jgi:hypothetical protein
MNYDDECELWYFIEARVSPTAQVCAVTHGIVSEEKGVAELEMSNETRVSVVIIIIKKNLSLVTCKIISLHRPPKQQ